MVLCFSVSSQHVQTHSHSMCTVCSTFYKLNSNAVFVITFCENWNLDLFWEGQLSDQRLRVKMVMVQCSVPQTHCFYNYVITLCIPLLIAYIILP